MPKTLDDARHLIQTRLVDIDAEADRLRRALRILEEVGKPSRDRSGRPPAAATRPSRHGTPRRRGPRRAARGQRGNELLAAIRADPGARPSALAKAIGIGPAQVHALIAKARAEKLIVRRGRGYVVKS